MVDDIRENIQTLLDSKGEGVVVAANVLRHLVEILENLSSLCP
jgi:hypothetical protein